MKEALVYLFVVVDEGINTKLIAKSYSQARYLYWVKKYKEEVSFTQFIKFKKIRIKKLAIWTNT